MGEFKSFGDDATNVDDLLSRLTIDEKISLLSGVDFWHTAPIERLDIPSIRVSDGPNGVRGTKFFNGTASACLPCGTALAATWDVNLVQRGGELQGQEAIAKGASVILGPTSNMQRSPLGGRGFESFSEDPVLAGNMTAATINGIQSQGVGATPKHFVCNDQEIQRMSADSILTERALREIYLMPFQIAQRDSKPFCYMTAYNKVNGTHVSENKRLIDTILRKEWGFDGLVMSDWFGTYSTTESVKAGLDLEMPGPSYVRGAKLVGQAVGCGKLTPHDIDLCVRRVLSLIRKVSPLGIPQNAPEYTIDTPDTTMLLRRLSTDSLVLLKNYGMTLPFDKTKSIAVIGPNANFAAISGGGSASLTPYRAVSPLEGIQSISQHRAGVKYALGAPGWKKLPYLTRISRTTHGKPGLTMNVYLESPEVKERKEIDTIHVLESNAFLADYKHPKLPLNSLYYCTFSGTITPTETAHYEFSVSVAGTAKLYVDNELVVDNQTEQHPGDSFFGTGTREEIGTKFLQAGKRYNVRVDFGTFPTITFRLPGVTPIGAGGIRIGCERRIDLAAEIKRAVALAQTVDQVVICAGLNADWESEGYDRANMDLPPGTDDLISAVCAANLNTAVIVQSGTPTAMPWHQEANAIVQAWYGGNETGTAIADVVFGDSNPSGKLPLSFPMRVEDNPAFLHSMCDMNRIRYGEGIYVGYRFYEKCRRQVMWPFGHGLSYTSFEIENLRIQVSNQGDDIVVKVDVRNTGDVFGAEVVQVYVRHLKTSVSRPEKELKGFTKVPIEAGQTVKDVQIKLSQKYATSFWDEARDAWFSEDGTYELLVGNSSSSDKFSMASFEVANSTWWRGL